MSGRFSGIRGPNFTKLGYSIGRSLPHYKFVPELRYLAELQTYKLYLLVFDVVHDIASQDLKDTVRRQTTEIVSVRNLCH